MGRPWAMRAAIAVIAGTSFALGAVGCGGPDYGDENHRLVEPLLQDASLFEVVSQSEQTYCVGDTCSGGGDGLSSVYEVTVLVDFDTVVQRFYALYPGYDVFVVECPDGPQCEVSYSVSATTEDALIYLDYYEERSIGLLSVDAHTPPVETSEDAIVDEASANDADRMSLELGD